MTTGFQWTGYSKAVVAQVFFPLYLPNLHNTHSWVWIIPYNSSLARLPLHHPACVGSEYFWLLPDSSSFQATSLPSPVISNSFFPSQNGKFHWTIEIQPISNRFLCSTRFWSCHRTWRPKLWKTFWSPCARHHLEISNARKQEQPKAMSGDICVGQTASHACSPSYLLFWKRA